MGYVVERPGVYLSRVAEGPGEDHSLGERLVPDLARVHVEGWRQAYGSLLPERFYDDDARAARVRMWTALLADEQAQDRVRIATTGTGDTAPGTGDVATGPDDVVKFSIHGPARDDDRHGIELFALYILEEHYGRGVGQRLLDEAIGSEPACLWVAAENHRVIRFYEKNGFQPDGTRKSDPDIDGLEEIRMARG